MRISDWSSDVCSSDLKPTVSRRRDSRIRSTKATAMQNSNGEKNTPARLISPNTTRGSMPVSARTAQCAARKANGAPGSPDGFSGCLARSEEQTAELQSVMRSSYAVFGVNKTKANSTNSEEQL